MKRVETSGEQRCEKSREAKIAKGSVAPLYGTCGWKKRREENQSPQPNITTTLHHDRNSSPQQYDTSPQQEITTNNTSPQQYITSPQQCSRSPQQYITTTIHHHHHHNNNNTPPQQYIIHHYSNTPQQQYIITTIYIYIYHHSNTSQGAWWLEIEEDPVFSAIKCVPAAMRGYVGNLVCATGMAHAWFRSIASYCVKLN